MVPFLQAVMGDSSSEYSGVKSLDEKYREVTQAHVEVSGHHSVQQRRFFPPLDFIYAIRCSLSLSTQSDVKLHRRRYSTSMLSRLLSAP